MTAAEIAQLGERVTEDHKVPGSIPGFGILIFFPLLSLIFLFTTVYLLNSLLNLDEEQHQA